MSPHYWDYFITVAATEATIPLKLIIFCLCITWDNKTVILTSELQSLACPVKDACITSTGIVSVPISISKEIIIDGLDSMHISPTGGLGDNSNDTSSLSIASSATSITHSTTIKRFRTHPPDFSFFSSISSAFVRFCYLWWNDNLFNPLFDRLYVCHKITNRIE